MATSETQLSNIEFALTDISDIEYAERDTHTRTRYIAQVQHLERAFSEARRLNHTAIRHLNGPYYPVFAKVLGETSRQLTAIHPKLSPDHLMPPRYRSRQAEIDIGWGGELRSYSDAIALARKQKREKLLDLGDSIGRHTATHAAIIDTLSETPYCRQGDALYKSSDHMIINPSRACFNACFRMVFAGVSGLKLDEGAVGVAADLQHQSSLIDDQQYLNVFNTDTFAELHDGTTQVLSITGADLSTIQKIATAYKQRRLGRRVFSIVSLASETGPADIWHTNVLLGATPTDVIAHDPSPKATGGRDRVIDKQSFYTRWAIAQNRAHIIVSDPSTQH